MKTRDRLQNGFEQTKARYQQIISANIVKIG